MAENVIPLPDGGYVVTDKDRYYNVTMNIKNLFKYRLVDDGSDIVAGEGHYVPNVDDMVFAFELGMFRVSRVDYTTFVADLVLWEAPKSQSDIGVEDVLLGVGPGYQSETWRCFIDTRTFPHRLQVNKALHLYGDECKSLIIYNGINITATGEVISAYYDQSGDYVSEEIPLTLVATEKLDNRSIKAPIMGYTSKKFPDGALVTAVAYNDQGMQISYAKLLVMNTNLTRRPDESMKRVRSIELLSPYLSKTEPNTLRVPLNYTVASLVLQGRVTYIDGKQRIFDVVDETANGKFKLLGLKYWSPSITGTPQDLDLVYSLSESEEYSYLQGETWNGAVREPYRIIAEPNDPARSLKLYAYPTWAGDVIGYVLDYWLFDLNRQVARRVPRGAVSLDPTSAPFDGQEYTIAQHLKFGVDLYAVDVEYGQGARHVQSSQITLLRAGSIANSTNWKLRFSGNQKGWYGEALQAVVKAGTGGVSTVNIANGAANKEVFLEKLYYGTEPLYDPQVENKAPEPTHFIIVTKTRTVTVPIGQWMNDIAFINDLTEGETIYVRWIKRGAGGLDLQLGVSGLPTHSQ